MTANKSRGLCSILGNWYRAVFEKFAGRPPRLPHRCPSCRRTIDDVNYSDEEKEMRICHNQWHVDKLLEEVLEATV